MAAALFAAALFLALPAALPADEGAPPSASEARPPAVPYKRVGLVLSGGGARGFAHIGVIKVLEEAGVPVDFIAGTSMGSIVGGLYSAGYSAAELEDIALETDWNDIFTDTLPRQTLSFQEKAAAVSYFFQFGFNRNGLVVSQGLTSGQKALHLLYLLTLRYAEHTDFDRLPIPYRAVAADLLSGDTIILKEGSLAAAMRASMAVPGIFTPLEMDGKLLVDGGVTKNLPVDVVKELGADIVIAVDLNRISSVPVEIFRPDEVLDQVLTIMIDQNQRSQRALADIIVEPDIRDYSAAAFDAGKQIIERGEAAARALLPELRKIRDIAAENRPPEVEKDKKEADLAEVVIDEVTIRGAKQDDELSIRNSVSPLLSRPMKLLTIHERVTAIYQSGRYEAMRYELLPGGSDGKKRLLILLSPRASANNLVRFGFSYDSFVRFASALEDPLNDRFTLKLNLSLRDIAGAGSFWSTDFSHISGSEIRSEFIQPLWGPVFLSPAFYLHNYERLTYAEELPDQDLKTLRVWGQLRLGTFLSRIGQVYAGWRLEGVKSSPLYGGEFEPFEGRVAYILLGARRDSLDRFPFPRVGSFGNISYFHAAEFLGGEYDFTQLSADFHIFTPLARRHVLEFILYGGTFFDSEAFDWNRWYLGGRSQFPGFQPSALSGRQSAVLGLHYRFQVPGLSGLPRDRIYLSLRGAAGNAWERDSTGFFNEAAELRYGGSFGVGVDSPIGAFHLDVGVNDRLRPILYVSIGNQL